VTATIAARHSGPSAEDIAKATPWERASTVRGKSEGQVMVFNKGGRLIAAQWSMASSCWIEVGDVTGNGGGDGGSIDGINYDHVMPVEIETQQGLKTLQLGYNTGENPYVAAQRFMDQNGLPNNYRAQIADWIIQRTGSSATTIDASGGGGGAYTNPNVFRFSKLSRGFVSYDDIVADFKNKAFNKVAEFNALESNRLSEAELASVQSVMSTLSETSWYHSSKIDKAGCAAIIKIVQSFDSSRLFPVFDILRLLAVHHDGADNLAVRVGDIVQTIISVLQGNDAKSVTSILMICRFVCNCFKNDSLRAALFSNIGLCTDLLRSLSLHASPRSVTVGTSSSKNIRLAIAIVCSNLGTLLNRNVSNAPAYVPVFCTLVHTLLASEDTNPRCVQDALIGYGTALVNGGLKALLVGAEVNNGFLYRTLTFWKARPDGSEVAAVITEIMNNNSM